MKSRIHGRSIRTWTLVCLFCWTLVVFTFGGLNYHLIHQSLLDQAHTKAFEAFNKDQSFRLWATMHGGVYVPSTHMTPPNSFLTHVDERDIVTPNGQELTLMNPAYMIRQLNETYGPLYGVQGHITSLKPLRPGNEPDAWEIKALRSFEQGASEAWEISDEPDGRFARLMRPMEVSEGCLKCHAHQGYKIGDVRGGVSVKVPMAPFVEAHQGQVLLSGGITSLIWLSGVGLLLFGASILSRNLKEREAIANDLRKAKIEAEAASRSKSEFLANMSHEIRTPLNGLMGLLQLVSSTKLDEEQDEYVGMALQSSRRLNHLLSDILDLSRVEADKLPLHNSPFSMVELFEEVGEAFRPVALESNLQLVSRVDEMIPETLYGDSARLQQIIVNLVGNAFKFTGEGSIRLEACMLPDHDPGKKHVLITISDTGYGIEEDKLDSLFDAFTQGAEGYTKSYQGAGLGLSICKRLVVLMGGSMSVESKIGIGTTFYISLPFNGKGPKLAPPLRTRGRKPVGLRVLLAEDDRVNQIFAKRLLEKLGYTVHAVPDGEQVMKALAREEYDLVFMDIQMPVMDGVEATKAIRKGEAGEHNADIPIVALTAYAMEGDREHFLDAGVDDYLAKPLEIDSLDDLLGRVRVR